MNRATSNRRLLKLADFLDRLPPDRFDYEEWVGRDWKGAQDLSCGTTACALGWAATMPEFRRLGLRLNAHPAPYPGGTVVNESTLSVGGDAAAEVFDVSRAQAEFLFLPDARCHFFDWKSPSGNASPSEVAAHIRRFVEERV